MLTKSNNKTGNALLEMLGVERPSWIYAGAYSLVTIFLKSVFCNDGGCHEA